VLTRFPRYVTSNYPSINLVADCKLANKLDATLPQQAIYTSTSVLPVIPGEINAAISLDDISSNPLHTKVDLIATFGGDGTILHASRLFSTAPYVPPILSFALGTLGFLGEHDFRHFKRAFDEAYRSGLTSAGKATHENLSLASAKEDGVGSPASRILLRHRLEFTVSRQENPHHHPKSEPLLPA
jgi:NADH kinase